MQTHTILIVLGAVLLLAGVMGGGLTLKEMKLPTLDRFSRALAGAVGVVFIAVGIYLERGAGPAAEDARAKQEEVERERKEALARAEAARQAELDRQRGEAAAREAKLRQQREEEARNALQERQRSEAAAREAALRQQREEAARRAEIERKRKEAELARQREEAERKAALERERREKERLAAAERERESKEADFTKRALLAPKSNAWAGEFRIYDPKTGNPLAKGELSFGPTTYAERIAYARLRIDSSTLRQLPRGQAEATAAVWGFMGGDKDGAISLVFGKAADNPILVFNKLIRNEASGYLEMRGVLFLTQGGKNQVVAHVSASCRAR